MSIRKSLLISAFCVLTALQALRAQPRPLPLPSDGDTCITISLLTCAPGRDVYELEGHSGLRMQYDGYDITANWGLFDYDSPNFIYRFVKGETDYSVGAYPTMAFLSQYRRAGRRVTEQVLDLAAEQSRRVIDLVSDNLYPENRVYRYNYVKDNCATRVISTIEKAIGDTVIFTTSANELDKTPTFRSEMRHFHRSYPWYQFGIDIALGSGIDYDISRRETIFAPVILQKLAADAQIVRNGKTAPLVKSTSVIIDGAPDGVSLPPTPWYLTPLAAMAALLAVTILITWLDISRRHRSRWFDAILFGISGLCGLVVAFLVFISVHEATSPNWILLWLNPLCLIVPLLQWQRKTTPAVKAYHIYNMVSLAVLTIIFISGIQSANTAFYPAMAAAFIRSYFYLYSTRNDKKHKK